MIEELPNEAKEELKRADHSIYVTLKYTRTVDVIKNTIKRLISAFDISIDSLMEFLKSKKKIKEIPISKREKAKIIAKSVPKIKEHIDTYLLLRKIDIANYSKREEYRKHVTLIAEITPQEIKEVNTVILRNFFVKTGEFIDFVEMVKAGAIK